MATPFSISSAAGLFSLPPLTSLAPRTTTTGNKNGRRAAVVSIPLDKSLATSTISSNPSTPSPAAVKTVSRRAAVAEVQTCTELDATLSRLEGILQVQDLNIILRHFGELRRWPEVSQVFDWMLSHEKLNFASYSGFIKYMGLSSNPMKALQVYDSIPDKSMKINVSICNSILGCMMKNGKFESSIKLFDQMKDEGLSPDLVTYSTLLAGCAKVKNGYSKAMQLVQELRQKGLRMDSVIYGTLLAICASNNLCEEAEAFFQQM